MNMISFLHKIKLCICLCVHCHLSGGLHHYWLLKMVNSLQAGVREISYITVESQVDAS